MTDAEMFGWQRVQPHQIRKKKKQQSSTRTGSALTNLSELKEGDFVVHISHGIARYGGVVRQEIAGAINDYLALEYEGKDRLYVPVGQLDRVQKYLGTDASPPPLSNLKSGNWEKTKKKVREETIAVARQLSELYAAREQAHKDPIAPDSPWQREMEAAFPFEETAGQLQAIEETKSDLESDKPMDRLVCGDVGYGKTEVAIRAAFKVVQDGKQVAVLVPTTVLAQQHYQTFSERLAAYPTRVEVISRFRTPGEIKKVVEDVRMGAVDILVGTHRLVQKDVEFRDLGLVIVDEEQRFGVMQKERLKELRKEVDILTLSATPIPRTLHFALGGLREMSLISDPPLGRLAVRTVVSPMRDDVVRQAIERELERDGQVYYVHNRISSIHHIAEHIRKLVPRARIGIGHGQMGDEELEQVMLDFMHGRSDILLSTTIIENGLDLPNVNTLIVDRAELLGLSQMYQLRGRVGRSPRQGYAYFFHGARGKLTETSEGRFTAIQEFTDLGAGFKIAMRDLEIRGAGDLLGVKQSGGIAQVGFELYTEMLNDAVQKLKRQPKVFTPRKVELPEVDLPVAAFLPDDYVKDERDRLNLYRKMANAQSVEDAESLRDELRDRFGALPQPAFNLIRVLKLRVWLLQARLRGISKTEQEVLIRLQPGDKFQDEDTTAVYAKLQKSFDHRALHNVSLRSREGIAIDTRVLSPSQLMRMVEETCETLATIRGARFLAMSG
ncbi:MAG TPA: transcription-repair coupling factor [Abditibacteriaceae bacterium]|nr:transcription-repair coupling factor [Abditibacteriaceae bacterium]